MIRALCAFVVVLCATLSIPRAWATPPSKEIRERVMTLHDNAVADWDAGNYLDALDKFSEAYRLYPTPSLRYNVARVLSDLGRDVEALETFEAFLAEVGDGADPAALGVAKARVDVLRRKVGWIAVRCTTVETEVSLDGRPLGTCAALRPIRVERGAHQLTAQRPGFIPLVASAQVQGGETVTTELRLAPLSAGRGVHKKWWFWVALVGGAGAVAAGATLGALYGQPKNPSVSYSFSSLRMGSLGF